MKTHPLNICMYTDGRPFDGNTLENNSLGGTETAVLQLAETFAALGHGVTLINNGNHAENKKQNGVVYKSPNKIQEEFTKPHDVSLVIRHPEIFGFEHGSKINVLWQHDLAFYNEKEKFLANTWNIDSVFTQSNFHKKQYREVMELPEDYCWVAGSGIDPELFPKEELARDSKKLIYAARPERGLEPLLKNIFPKLLEHDSELKLYVTTYDGFSKKGLEFLNGLKEFAKQFGDSVVWLPPQTKKELYKHFKTSYLYLYPVVEHSELIGHFKETYCLSIDECQACGLPFISRELGAISDTLYCNAGYLMSGIEGLGSTYGDEFCNYYTQAVIDILKDPEDWERMSEAGVCASENKHWKVRANQFIEKFNELITEKEKQNNKITAIVKTENNEATIIRCLNSIKNHVDEILIDDYESTDNTLKLVEQYGCKVIPSTIDVPDVLRDMDNNWVLFLGGAEEAQSAENLEKYANSSLFNWFRFKNEIKFIKSRQDNKSKLVHEIQDVSTVNFGGQAYNFNVGACTDLAVFNDLFLLFQEQAGQKGKAQIYERIKAEFNKYAQNKSFISYEVPFVLELYSEVNRAMKKGFVFEIAFDAYKKEQNRNTSKLKITILSYEDIKNILEFVLTERMNPFASKYYLEI